MSTFLQMQQQLAEYLGEESTDTGYWSQSIKQRFINLGVKDAMLQTKEGPRVIDGSGTTTPSTRTYALPTDFLMPKVLYIDGKPYRRITEERELELLDGDFDNAASYAASDLGTNPTRFYTLDLTAEQYRILPTPTSTLQIRWLYLKLPTTLTANADVPNIPKVLHELPAKWAAWQLTYRDKDHASRGSQLRQEYLLELSQAIRFLNEGIDAAEVEFGLDPKYFSPTGQIVRNFDIVGG